MDQDCSICLTKINLIKDDISVTKCGHLFHQSCIEGAIRLKNECPICKTNINDGIVKKLYVEVDEGLVYNGSYPETEKILEETKERDSKTRKTWLNRIKKLEKDNSELKTTNKSVKKQLDLAKTFLKVYQKEIETLEKRCIKLESEKNNLQVDLEKMKQGLLTVENEASKVLPRKMRRVAGENTRKKFKGLFFTYYYWERVRMATRQNDTMRHFVTEGHFDTATKCLGSI